jgi:ferredoxin-NADP reductase/CRP-like cAMP-binding protein
MSDALAAEALGLLSALAPFKTLPADELQAIAQAVEEQRFSPGDMIVREGDPGDALYLIAEGSVQVIGRAFEGSDVVLARLEAGQFFGEQALLPGGSRRRNASIRAVGPCRMLSLSRDALLGSLDEDSDLSRQFRERGELQKALRDSQLREEVLRKLNLADKYEIVWLEQGDWVFHQGEPGEHVYLIMSGAARVVQEDEAGWRNLAELGAGQFFGELAVLERSPRSASVVATSRLELVRIDGAWFRTVLETHPQLRSIMSSLKHIYMMPDRGLLTLQTGKLGTQPTLTGVYHLPDGRQILTTRLVDVPAFTARQIGAPEAEQSARFTDADTDTVREIHLADGRLIEIESDGPWDELGSVMALMLSGAVLSEAQVRAFRSEGRLGRPEPRYHDDLDVVVCRCSNVTVGRIFEAMQEGADDLETLTAKTLASLVCGGCTSWLKEFVGQSDWTLACCDAVTPLAHDIAAFRLRPKNGRCAPGLPGQHVVVEARINGQRVQRPYTISSPPHDESAYEITVKKEPDGFFSRWLFEQVDTTTMFRISRPSGTYFIPQDYRGDVVCLVGGIGVTPALAIARAFSAGHPLSRLHVDYSVSTPEASVCLDELRALARDDARFTLNLRITSREGRLDAAAVDRLVADYPSARFYLCAGASFLTDVHDLLREAGVDEDRIQIERFSVAGEAPRA